MRTTTVNDESLNRAFMASSAVHVFLLMLLYLGLPTLFKPLPIHHEPVPFEIVDISDLTNTRIQEQPQPISEPPQPPPKQSPQSLPEPQPKPQDQDTIVLKKLKPLAKPKPPEIAKPKPDLLASVLKNVEKLKTTPPSKAVSKEDTTKAEPQKSLAPVLSQRLTISEEDALRRQISQCWNMPVGARDAQNLIVEVVINVNPDRTVQHAEVVDKSRMARDSFFQAAAEAAIRALFNPHCSPLELPADKYEQWKVIDFTFDPRDML